MRPADREFDMPAVNHKAFVRRGKEGVQKNYFFCDRRSGSYYQCDWNRFKK